MSLYRVFLFLDFLCLCTVFLLFIASTRLYSLFVCLLSDSLCCYLSFYYNSYVLAILLFFIFILVPFSKVLFIFENFLFIIFVQCLFFIVEIPPLILLRWFSLLILRYLLLFHFEMFFEFPPLLGSSFWKIFPCPRGDKLWILVIRVGYCL